MFHLIIVGCFEKFECHFYTYMDTHSHARYFSWCLWLIQMTLMKNHKRTLCDSLKFTNRKCDSSHPLLREDWQNDLHRDRSHSYWKIPFRFVIRTFLFSLVPLVDDWSQKEAPCTLGLNCTIRDALFQMSLLIISSPSDVLLQFLHHPQPSDEG